MFFCFSLQCLQMAKKDSLNKKKIVSYFKQEKALTTLYQMSMFNSKAHITKILKFIPEFFIFECVGFLYILGIIHRKLTNKNV